MTLPTLLRRGQAADPYELARNDFNNMLNRLVGGVLLTDNGDGGLAVPGGYGVDIREDADHIYVEADLPGFNKDDVDIALENGALTITAEHREETAAPAGQAEQAQRGKSQAKDEYLLHERRVQRFVRSFTLPPNVDEQSPVQAKLENGVLKITLNKRQESKPKRIQVS